MQTIIHYFNEANVAALFSVVILAALARTFIIRRNDLTTRSNQHTFQEEYSMVLGVLSGVLVYIALRVWLETMPVEAAGCGILLGILIGALSVISLDRPHNYPKFLIWMGIKVLVPFTIIFAFQSHWYCGVGLFLVIVILPVGVVTLKDYFDWLSESSRIDDF